MLVVKCLTLAYAASVLVLASATSLQIVGAGVRGFNGPRLISGSSLCTNDYPNGFSIVCDAPGASAAVFFVNGIQQRREGVAPYTINGDVSGNIFKWTPPAGVVTIDCNPVGAPSVSVSVKFACTPAPAPSPSPSSVPAVVTLRAVQAGTSGNDRTIKKLAPGFTLCPTDFTNGLSLVCDAPDAASVTFKVNGAVVRKESVVPFTIAGDSNGIVNAWKSFPSGAVTITCTTSTGESLTIVGSTCVPVTSAPAPVVTPKPSPSAAAVVGIDRNYCVGLKATSFVGSLSPGWTVDGESLWFRRYFDGTGIVDPDNAPLAYKFKVPVASTYGFTLDMKTAHVVDHNDIYVMMQGGWTARGANKDTGEPSVLFFGGATKAYHNDANARRKLAFTVDFNAHTFSTAQVLQPGIEYTLVISGRSSKVQLFGAILFPCNGDQCKVGTSHWQQYIGICNV